MNKLLDVIGATKKGEEMLSVLGEKGLNEIYDYTLKQGQLRAYILGLVNTKRYMKTGEKQYTIITSKKEIGEFLELSSRKNNQIKDMLHFFRRKDIKAEDNKSSIYTGLIESFEFEKYQDKVIINLNKKASDMFFSKRYVKYNTHMVKSFKSKYSLGFYELFRFKKGNKRYISWIFDLNDIYGHFNIKEEYKKDFYAFKRRILNPVFKDLKENTDMILETKGKSHNNSEHIKIIAKSNSKITNKLKYIHKDKESDNINNISTKGIGSIYS